MRSRARAARIARTIFSSGVLAAQLDAHAVVSAWASISAIVLYELLVEPLTVVTIVGMLLLEAHEPAVYQNRDICDQVVTIGFGVESCVYGQRTELAAGLLRKLGGDDRE